MVETQFTVQLEQDIANKENYIKSLKECLPYADGQAYYNDARLITQLEVELHELKKQLREM